MAKTKEISRRIKSVSSTKKITKAMEMVAAAKMRRSVEAVLKTRTYANLSWETVSHLADLAEKNEESRHPLLYPRAAVKRVAVVLITSNRGMCGGYNSAVIAKAEASVRKHAVPTDFIVVGRKGAAVAFHGYEVAAKFEKSDLLTDINEISPLAKLIVDSYESGQYDKVFVAYTDFISQAKQVPRVKQLLPIQVGQEEKYLGIIGEDSPAAVSQELISRKEKKHLGINGAIFEYKFEPDARTVLDKMIPRLIKTQLFQAYLEASASEHSARMTAMHQATSAAGDMVAEMTLFYNKARQAGITAEIAEISAGANALAD